MKRKKVYVCAPYSGTLEEMLHNRKLTIDRCRALYEQGYHPIAPQLFYPSFLEEDDPEQRQFGLDAGLEELKRCDVVWIFGEKITEGMLGEINTAILNGIPLRCIAEPEKELKEEPPACWHTQTATDEKHL